MKILRSLNEIHQKFSNPVLTLGNFDGVHRGHQAIFKKVVERARAIQGTSIAFTFEPHPLKVLAPDRSPKLLNTFRAKMELIADMGIDIAICAKFTSEFAAQDPEDFARKVLHEQIGVKEIFVGYDYAFGKGRGGSIASLRAVGEASGFVVNVVNPVRVNNVIASSSTVREFISTGKVEEAAELLGRYYAIEGEIVHGSRRGHKLGFPTANVRTPNELLPPYGVYAVRAKVDGDSYDGVAAIGVRPTFDTGFFSIEVYLFDFYRDIYGKQMEVSFIRYLREEKKFSDPNALIEQMHRDVEDAKKALRDRRMP